MNTHGYWIERLRRSRELLRVPAWARRLRLGRQELTATPRPRTAGPRRWPIRRSDLEVFLSTDTRPTRGDAVASKPNETTRHEEIHHEQA
jgi:hypothetical protein